MRFLFWRKREDDLDAEIESHLTMSVRDHLDNGESSEQAEFRSRRELGNVALVKEVTRATWGLTWVEQLIIDLRLGFRNLRKNPGFTFTALLTLALAIGANTAIFSIVRAVIIRPLPFANSDRLVQLQGVDQKSGEISDWLIYRDIADFREQNHSFESIAASRFMLLNLTGIGAPEALYGSAVSHEMFETLGVSPLLGRVFTAAEDIPGQEHVVLLSYGLWQRELGGDKSVIGKKLNLSFQDQQQYEVIGVMPPDFNFPLVIPTSVNPPTRQMAFWIPIGLDASKQPRSRTVMITARLRPNISVAQAQTDLDRINSDLARIYPDTNTGRKTRVVSFAEFIFGPARKAMLIIWGATAIVILIACANIANLLLARAVNRRREIGIRLALGAGRGRLVRQWIVESLLLAALGGLAGLLLAGFCLKILIRIAPPDIPRIAETRIDAAVMVLTIAVSLISGLMFGLFPAWQAAGGNPQDTLKDGGRCIGPSRGRARELLIIAELAMCVPLAIGAVLLVQSVIRLLNVNTGFQTDKVVTSIIVLPNSRYQSRDSKTLFFKKLIAQLETLPSVESAAAVDGVPLSGNISGSYVKIENHPSTAQGDDRLASEVFSITPNYFNVLGMPLISGRSLTSDDSTSNNNVAVINDTAATKFWPGEDPLGKRILLDGIDKSGDWRQVVGVVKTTRDAALSQSGRPAMYVPVERGISPLNFPVVRTRAAGIDLSQDIRNAVIAVDKDIPVFLVTSMRELVDNSAAQQRFNASMLSVFGLLATVLAALGVYGVVSYSVSNRTQEIGVRMALGASKFDILRLVISWAITRTGIGLAIGLVAAFALMRFISSLLFEVSANDSRTFVGVSVGLVIVALSACYLPARRSAKIDPMEALRNE